MKIVVLTFRRQFTPRRVNCRVNVVLTLTRQFTPRRVNVMLICKLGTNRQQKLKSHSRESEI